MNLTIRVDLDYVPWDSPDAQDLGHGEPAALIRLLDLARRLGWKIHFFASNRHLRAFPSAGDAVLNDGHHLDWLCKHPTDRDRRVVESATHFASLGEKVRGWAVRGEWPTEAPLVGLPEFVTLGSRSAILPCPQFPIDIPMSRAALVAGLPMRTWTDEAISQMRESDQSLVLATRLQTLAKFDSRLTHFSECMLFAQSAGFKPATLRDRLEEVGSSS